VLEFVSAIADSWGLDMRGVEQVRTEKAHQRGGFVKRLIWAIQMT
jgi:predicted house-cleaning noncanonical NTP pyrophosphatase (MazG superfamily)